VSAAATLPAVTPGQPLPLSVRFLGYAGLLPFAGGALLLWLLQGEAFGYAAFALAAYAALIASFLGGIHWGLAMQAATVSTGTVLWGVLPSLVAWPAVLMPPRAGLVWLALLIAACYLVDRRAYPRLGVPAPWLALRFRLSAVAALSCLIGAAAHP
jgi:hypothetical protein